MKRRRLVGPAILLVLAVAAAVVWFVTRPESIPDKMPSAAPAVGSCWSVDAATAKGTLPWPGAAVGCTAGHTAEVFHTGQVQHSLIQQSRSGNADEAKVARNFMYAAARQTCAEAASKYLGVNWHQAQVTVLASWITPAKDGFYGCALAQTADPGGTRLVSRTGSLKDTGPALAIACVARATGGSLGYSGCDQTHDGEFTGIYTVTPPNAVFNAKALDSALTKGCDGVAVSYVGAPRNDLTVGYVGPTSAATWLGSDQTFACYAMSQVKLRGTVRSLGTRPLPH